MGRKNTSVKELRSGSFPTNCPSPFHVASSMPPLCREKSGVLYASLGSGSWSQTLFLMITMHSPMIEKESII
jgi:hypothetical protein